MTSHTPTPWVLDDEGETLIILGPRKDCIRHGEEDTWEMCRIDNSVFWDDAATEAEDRANAAFIVSAVNSHAALVAENARLKADAEWLALNAGAEHPHYPYRNDLGYWAFPYLVSNAGGFGGGVGEASFDTLSEAIAAARDFKSAA